MHNGSGGGGHLSDHRSRVLRFYCGGSLLRRILLQRQASFLMRTSLVQGMIHQFLLNSAESMGNWLCFPVIRDTGLGQNVGFQLLLCCRFSVL